MVGMQLRALSPAAHGRLVVRVAATVLVATLALGGPTARGGDDPLAISASLGLGMHAYHAGDYQRSYDDLSAVIETGSRDPRAYYFRGLAALKLGRTDEAEADFTAGAEREADGSGTSSVSRSLERVQGCDRLALERHRARARLIALQREREAAARRYAPDREGGDVLRRRRPEAIPRTDAAARAGDAGDDDATAPAEELPAGDEAGKAEAEPADTSDPFGDEPADDDKPAAEESDQKAEVEAAEAEDTAAEADQREEELNAEAEDAAAQQDEREEMEEAGEKAAEEVQDGTTSLDQGVARGQGA